LQSIQRAVTTYTNQSVNTELFETRSNDVELILIVWIDIIPRGANEGASLCGIKFGYGLEQRVQVNVRNPGIEQAVESLYESKDFKLELIGADHGAVDSGVERRSVSAG